MPKGVYVRPVDISERISKGVRRGLDTMTLEAKRTMITSHTASMSNRCEVDKIRWRKDISGSVRATNVARNLGVVVPDVSDDFAGWFTGFWEGDSDICCMLNVNNLGSGFVFKPEIEFAQKDIDVVEYIARELGGDLGWAKRKQGLYRQLRWTGQRQCISILKLLSLHVVSQRRCDQINIALLKLGLPLCVVHMPTMLWAAGFWDAEGSVEVPNGPVNAVITYYQKEHELLETLQSFLSKGVITSLASGCRLTIRMEDARELANVLLLNTRIERKRDMLVRRFGFEYGQV